MLELEFSQALEAPNKEFELSENVTLDIEEDVFYPHKILGEASVNLKYFVDYDSILHLSGNIRVPCKFLCDRCGSSFERNLYLELNEQISPKMSEEDELSYDMPIIDLQKVISSYVLLNFPSKVLCREDCKGLCMHCGANLNEGNCDCSNEK